MQEKGQGKNLNKKHFRSFFLDAEEDKKLIILAALRGYSKVTPFIKSLIDEAFRKAESEGLFQFSNNKKNKL